MYLEITLLSLIIVVCFVFLIKIFVGKTILKTNAEYGTQDLLIEKSGFYSLWVNGEIFSKPTLEKFNAMIINENEKRFFDMPSFFRANTNNGSSGSILLECYYLEKGTYKFKIGNGSQSHLTNLDKIAREFIPGKLSYDFGYTVKRTLPELIFPLCLIGIIFSIMQILEILK